MLFVRVTKNDSILQVSSQCERISENFEACQLEPDGNHPSSTILQSESQEQAFQKLSVTLKTLLVNCLLGMKAVKALKPICHWLLDNHTLLITSRIHDLDSCIV